MPATAMARSRRWLARLSFLLAGAAVAILVIFADLRSVAMLGIGLASAALSLSAAYWFLAQRGLRRWGALTVLVLSPAAVIAVFAFSGLLWVAAASAGAWLLAALTARVALRPEPADWLMTEHPARPRARHPFLIMNPKSGGGKVARFDLKRQAERLGAKVCLMDGPGPVDVEAVARRAVADGADLLGVAGGDGTQALVAGVAADHDLPFVVITAGTRNHFALDLGLDRDDPAACLRALDDGVDLQVDLGDIGGQTFVNNASFGAYAEIVKSPAYRDDKLGSTLDLLPDLLGGQRGSKLAARAGEVRIDQPQAVLVANNPYDSGDIAGLSRRSRLDSGLLGIVGVTVRNGRQAAGLMRGSRSAGISVLTAPEVTVSADTPEIRVGIDGEAVSLPTPVRCAIRPGALRVRVPRQRPGVPPPRPRMNWAQLWQLVLPRRPQPAARPEGGPVTTGYRPFGPGQDVPALLRELRARTAVFDIEPLVAIWDTSETALDDGIGRVLDGLTALPGLAVVCFATNSARAPAAAPAKAGLRVIYVSSARKPLDLRPYRDLPRPGVVVGDQVATDGILARRLGFTFLHYRHPLAGAPLGPRLMNGCGQLVRPLVFRPGGLRPGRAKAGAS